MRMFLRFVLALVMAPLLFLCSCGTNSDNAPVIVFADVVKAVKGGELDKLIAHDHRSVRDAIIGQIDSASSSAIIESVVGEYENLTHIRDLGYRYRFFSQLTDETRIARDSLLIRKLLSSESSATYTIYSDSLLVLATGFAYIGDSISLALTLFDLAEVLFYDSLKLEKAKSYLDSAINLMLTIDDPPTLGYFYFQASYWYRTRLANYRVAEAHAIRAVRQYELVNYSSAVVAAREAVGVAQFQQQEYYRALKWFSLAAGGPDSHYYLGYTLLGLNQFDSAAFHAAEYLELVESAKEFSESDIASAHTLMGRVMAQQGERQGANAHFELAEKLLKLSGSQKERAISLIFHARLLNDERNAVDARRVLSDVTIDLSVDKQIQLFFNLEWARALYHSGMIDSAQKILWENIEVGEKMLAEGTVSGSQLRFFQDKLEFYNLLSFCYYSKYCETQRLEYLDSSLIVQELSRARTLTSRSGTRAAGYQDRFDKLIQAISLLQKRLFLKKDDSLLTAIASLEDSLRYFSQSQYRGEVRADVARTVNNGSPLSRMMKTENGASATLYYITGRDRSLVIVGRGNSIHAYDLEFNSNTIDSLVNQLRKDISHPPVSSAYEDTFVRIARKLGDELVFSRLQDTSGLKNVRVVPSHHLALLPFAALIDSHGNYLIENYALEYASSLRKSAPVTHKGIRKSFLFVTSETQELDSTFNGVDTRDLNLSQYYDITLPKDLGVRFAGKEIETISSELGANISVTQVGPTEEEFWSIKPDTFSTIFVATHSLVHTSRPERSALLLLPSETDLYDGLVQPFEIESHTWHSDLIFLSTCESGGGERVVGEGTLSLARSFIHGGAQNVVATMWPLDDRFSATFSSRFFSEYNKGVSAGQALRVTQQKIIESSRTLYKHPFYWASYHCIN